MNLFVFDIETVPDTDTGRRLYGQKDIDQLNDEEVARIMFHERYRETEGKTEMLRHHLQKVVAISGILDCGNTFKIGSLCEPKTSEKEIIQRFFDIIQKTTPLLVTWNGGGFDLPVLHYRAMLHGVIAPTYWKNHGEDAKGEKFRFNNYLSRYHERHTDLMDVLSRYQAQAFVPLNEMALMLGLPGKLGLHGDQVWETYLQGDIQKIRHYCEIDVLNTYLIFLRFELIRGHLTHDSYAQVCQRLRHTLSAENQPHFQEFLAAWNN